MSAPAAFVLAAGLGTRLAPLTDSLPKPLVPVFHKPLVTFAIDSLLAAGVGTLALNTHHLPEAFPRVFGEVPTYGDRPLHLFHEPLLLDTGGGIRNARAALGESTFFLYNGDILADLPLGQLLDQHRAKGALATLLLRPGNGGGAANICFDEESGSILDLRGVLGVREGAMAVYSGIAVFEPEIFDWIPSEGRYSIIDSLLDAMRQGEKVAGMLCGEGLWMDLGTPAAYLQAHHLLADRANRPTYITDPSWPQFIHPDAVIDPSATLGGMIGVAAGAVVGKGASVRDSILWPGSVIEPGTSLEGCVVSSRLPVAGAHKGTVF
ncbi:MAG: NDP-sugar synthase [Verrucomicrobia bacterium]|nr:NDP-sugar synthase [Verrucomicrobiota bacterium]